jgi:hypothetical protein
MLEDFDATVAEFMQEFGGLATFIIAGEAVRDLETGDVTFSETEYEVEAILLDLTLQSNGSQMIDGTLIQAGDKRAFVRPLEKKSPSAVMPAIEPSKDKFKMGGNTFNIVTLKETNPSGNNNVMFELYLRR